MSLVRHPEGDYLFLPGISPYSCGVVSAPGFEVAHMTFRRPLPYREAFDRIRDHLAAQGRPGAALCAIELRSPRPFTFQGKYYNLKDIYVAPEPLQKPHPPLWVAATAPAAAERAGRYGAGLHGSCVGPAFHGAYFRGVEVGG